MAEKSNFTNLFWIFMAVLIATLSVFGGLVVWKLLRSATPQIERAHIDPEQVLEESVPTTNEEQEQIKIAPVVVKKKTAPEKGTNRKYSYWSEEAPVQPEENDGFEEGASEDVPSISEQDIDSQLQEQGAEFSYALEEMPSNTTAREHISSSSKKAARSAKPVKPKQPVVLPKYTNYNEGLLRCQTDQVFPCAWEDNSNDAIVKQYWLRNSQGPVERVVYNKKGDQISQTFIGFDGVVTQYKGAYAELYFNKGLLTKIRTFPYEKPSLRDWFLIGNDGKFSACLCGISTKNCCARSLLYREGGSRRYCDLFPLDADVCKK